MNMNNKSEKKRWQNESCKLISLRIVKNLTKKNIEYNNIRFKLHTKFQQY